MPKRAPLFMRDMLSARNSADRWKGATLNGSDKKLIERSLSLMLEQRHNDSDAYLAITSVIAKLRNLPV